MTRLIVRAAAEADMVDARNWYAVRDVALAARFIDELRATLSRVREMPHQFPDVGGARRALLHRFSHAIYFVLPPDEEKTVVVAVLHQSRATAAWRRRVERRDER
jgi:plasmid stabilization system protein ParE